MIRAIIFDLDGVLIDATQWHFEALNSALGIFGYEISEEEHLNKYNGLPTTEKLKILTKEKGLPLELHEIIKIKKRQYTEEKINLNCRPSYDKQIMLSNLKEKYLLACCSNAQKKSIINMLTKAQIIQYFDVIIGNDEGYLPKPKPDIYLASFKKLNISPKEALIIEDAPAGIKAAIDSGAIVVKVKGYKEVDYSLFEDEKINEYESGIIKYNLNTFTKGWFIGDFDPSLLKTKDFEIAVKEYKAGDSEVSHFHKLADEYTLTVSGVFKMNSIILKKGDIVFLEKNTISDFHCIEEGSTVVVKVPCVKNDKYIEEK
jgi:HAD superfamily hydrolase (TIGR01509 family)